MSSVDTWPKAVQNWLKAAHISPRFRGRLAFWLAGTRFEGFVASVVLVPSGTTPHTRESRFSAAISTKSSTSLQKPSDCPCEATGTRDTARLEPTWVEDSQVFRISFSRLAAN